MLLIVVVGTFCLLEAAPGDAVDAYLVSTGGDAGMIELCASAGASTSRRWRGLRSISGRWRHFDLGWSVTFSRPILDVILERLPNTLLLMGSATALSFGLGSALGIVAGARPGSVRDRCLSIGSLALYAVPGFWLGLVLIVVFAVQLRWLPIARHRDHRLGQDRPGARARHRPASRAAGRRARLHLPGALSPHDARRHGRGLAQDFVLAARATRPVRAGASCCAHVARNALLPLVTMLGLQSAAMLGGSVVIESVFAIPGLGRLAQEAVAARDTPLLLGIILVSAVLVIVVNLARRHRSTPCSTRASARRGGMSVLAALPAHARRLSPAR